MASPRLPRPHDPGMGTGAPGPGFRAGPWRCLFRLGTGSFGMVHVWEHSSSGEKVALKRCRFGPEVLLSDKHRDQWRQEVDIMLRLQHPNVVRCRTVPEELAASPEHDDRLPMLCMEFCGGGDLRNQLNKARNCVGLEQGQVLACASDLASALGFLHNRRIIHRDLKPENVVLSDAQDPERRFIYKLIDLGYAKELGQSSLALSFVGTLQYIAPELFLSQEYTKSVDYWSLGFLCFEIATGQRPFLPTFSPGQWMDHVRHKSPRTICIHQIVRDQQQEGEPPEIASYETLLPENHLSRSLQRDLEAWLRPLLEWDPRRRGKSPTTGEICLFNDLGAMLAKRRISVACVDRAEHKLDYVVTSATEGAEFSSWIERDCGIPAAEQLLLTEAAQAVGPEDPVADLAAKIFVFHFPCNLPVSERVKQVGLRVPSSVQPLLKRPREEISYPRRKQILAHVHFFTRQEQRCCKDMQGSLRVLVAFVLGRLKDVGRACRASSAAVDSALSKYSFFRESLQHDLEKYRQQTRRKDHITSNQMHESWVISDREMESRAIDLSTTLKAAEEAAAAAAAAAPSAKTALQEELEEVEPLGKYVDQSLKLLEGLKCIPVEGRRERESAMEVAQLVVKVMKRRDAFLHDHFHRRQVVLDCHRATLEAARAAAMTAAEAEALCGALTRAQRRRQSDLWKLLAAAVQQGPSAASSPSPSTSSSKQRLSSSSASSPTAEVTQRALEENKDLRERFCREMKMTEDAINLGTTHAFD